MLAPNNGLGNYTHHNTHLTCADIGEALLKCVMQSQQWFGFSKLLLFLSSPHIIQVTEWHCNRSMEYLFYNYGRKLTIKHLQGDNRIVDQYQLSVAEIVASQIVLLATSIGNNNTYQCKTHWWILRRM